MCRLRWRQQRNGDAAGFTYSAGARPALWAVARITDPTGGDNAHTWLRLWENAAASYRIGHNETGTVFYAFNSGEGTVNGPTYDTSDHFLHATLESNFEVGLDGGDYSSLGASAGLEDTADSLNMGANGASGFSSVRITEAAVHPTGTKAKMETVWRKRLALLYRTIRWHA